MRQHEWIPPTLPGFSLIRKIGAGAFGEVWLARHQTLQDRLRAVKLVRREAFATTSAFREEFRGLQLYQEISRESQYLVSLYQVGHEESFYYYEMDLADDLITGNPCSADDEAAIAAYQPQTLSAQVRQQPNGILPVSECVRLGHAMAEALESLHDEGFTHRDVKPENIVYVKGVPRLADIGTLAHAEARRPIEALGYTPAEGAGQPRADIFSLGRTLFFASSGNDPLYHFGSFPESYYEQDLHDRKKLEAIIDQAVQHSPKARYRSIHAMREDLDAVSGQKRPGRGTLWIGGSVAACLALVGAVAAMREPTLPAESPSPPVAVAAAASVETSLRVLVVSRSGRNVKEAELCLGTESHAVNWNDADHWQSADLTVTAWTQTPLYLSVRASGYKPQDVSPFEFGEDLSMPHLVNVALVPEPSAVVLSATTQLFKRGGVSPITPEQERLTLVPERDYRFEVIDPDVHAVHDWDLFVEPGETYTVPSFALVTSSLPIPDSRVRAPWLNSLGMAFINVPGKEGILWAQYETRLIDFRAFCEDAARDFEGYETDLWDASKSDRAFLSALSEEDQARYRALPNESERVAFIERHPFPSERKARLRHPATKVTLQEIRAFATWLTRRDRSKGLLDEGLAYRLPLDVEWSAVAGLTEEERLVDPMKSGLTLLNLVEAEVLTREELRKRSFRMENLGNVIITRETLQSFAPDTQVLVSKAVARQQLNMRIDRARRLSPTFVSAHQAHIASKDTIEVANTAANAFGLHGMNGNVSEVLQDSVDFYQLVLRGPSFHTQDEDSDPASILNLRVRMLAPKNVRNLSFGFRLVLAADKSQKTLPSR